MIYLASPYSHPDATIMEDRFARACQEAGRFMVQGHVIFSPIAHTHPIAVRCDLPKGWDYWEKFDTEFIERCEAVWVMMLPGWKESKGVAAEVAIADRLGKPVCFVSPY